MNIARVTITTHLFPPDSASPTPDGSGSKGASPEETQVFEDRQAGLAITGLASRAGWAGENDARAYHVTVSVRNIGAEPIEFDEAEAIFRPERGAVLRVETHASAPASGPGSAGQSPQQPTKRAPRQITPGGAYTIDVTTNGYTASLLRDARNELLSLSVQFKRKDAATTPLYVTLLPRLEQLPVGTPYPSNQTEGQALRFQRAAEAG